MDKNQENMLQQINVKVQNEILPYAERVGAMIIATQDDAEESAIVVNEIGARIKGVQAWYKPLEDVAKAMVDTVKGHKDASLAPLNAAKAAILGSLKGFQERERIRLTAEAQAKNEAIRAKREEERKEAFDALAKLKDEVEDLDTRIDALEMDLADPDLSEAKRQVWTAELQNLINERDGKGAQADLHVDPPPPAFEETPVYIPPVKIKGAKVIEVKEVVSVDLSKLILGAAKNVLQQANIPPEKWGEKIRGLEAVPLKCLKEAPGEIKKVINAGIELPGVIYEVDTKVSGTGKTK